MNFWVLLSRVQEFFQDELFQNEPFCCHLDRTVQEVYEATLRKSKMLRWAGYTIVGKWECEFENDKKTDPQIQEFLKTLEFNPVSA